MKSLSRWTALLPLLLVFFAGSAKALQCRVTPEYSIVAAGESVELSVQCDDSLLSADWKMNGQSVTGVITLTQSQQTWSSCDIVTPSASTCPPPVKFATPVALDTNGSIFSFTVDVVANDGLASHGTVSSNPAMVYVKPTNVLAAAGGQAGTAAIDAQCGSSSNTAVQSMPSGAAQCAVGTPALAISGSTSFSWLCASPNNGAEANCYAIRGYTVTASAGQNGSVSPSSQPVATGETATVTATPSMGYSPIFSSSCGGSASGNTFTTGPVNANCSITTSFSNNVTGACGSQNGQLTTSILTASSPNLCNAGNVSEFLSGTSAFTWKCLGAGSGTTAICQAGKGYTVSTNAGVNGSISPATRTVAHGTTTTFTVTPSPGYVASTSGCGGSLSGASYTTGPVTTNCVVSATFSVVPPVSNTDPGIGSGLWVPPNTTNWFVADQSGAAVNKTSYVPGCLNGAYPPSGSSSGCAGSTSFTAKPSNASSNVTVTIGSGKTLSVRYRSTATAGSSLKFIELSGYDGGNVGYPVKVWLSDTPGKDLASVSAACQGIVQYEKTHPTVATGPGYCSIQPNKLYYLNIRTAQTGTFRYQIQEAQSDFE